MIPTISRDELKAKIDHDYDFVLIEALPVQAYRQAHLPGAVNIPPGRVADLAPRLVPDKGKGIVVYCASPT